MGLNAVADVYAEKASLSSPNNYTIARGNIIVEMQATKWSLKQMTAQTTFCFVL